MFYSNTAVRPIEELLAKYRQRIQECVTDIAHDERFLERVYDNHIRKRLDELLDLVDSTPAQDTEQADAAEP